MRIISLIGARPQFIKEAIVQRELQRAGISEVLVNSGQHYDANMSDVFFQDLEIRPPQYNLRVGSASHAEMTGKIIIEFEKIVLREKPDWVLVYGDTNTTLAGALVASKLKIPIAHIEAGVRMFPKDMPEEINRTLTDRVSKLLFCASTKCVENLASEGIREGVYFTGDVMYDIFLMLKPKFKYEYNERYRLDPNSYAVLTLHRDYNVDTKERLQVILANIATLAKELPIIFPMHPRTSKRVEEFGLQRLLEDVKVLEPIDYLNLMGLVSKSRLVLTDSGGLQKEAYYADKPALLFMEDPAWHELVEHGINILVKDNPINILARTLASDKYPRNIYGNGTASEQIARILKSQG